ncbi:hypothetical protein ACVBEF_16315 [Glaciimonas sp. GG7]
MTKAKVPVLKSKPSKVAVARKVTPVATKKGIKIVKNTIASVPLYSTVSYNALVKRIAKDFGVKVGSVSPPAKNPYSMASPKAGKVLRDAGIITKTGKLATRFK